MRGNHQFSGRDLLNGRLSIEVSEHDKHFLVEMAVV